MVKVIDELQEQALKKINEVKSINNLVDDEINSGEKLIIPYFE